jgi:hypothetical protein
MAKAIDPCMVPWTEEETAALDYALTVLHWEKLKLGLIGKKIQKRDKGVTINVAGKDVTFTGPDADRRAADVLGRARGV